MEDTTILSLLDDVDALAGTMFAEASGDLRQGNSSVEERLAVGCVVRNRLPVFHEFGADSKTYRALCLAHNEKGTWQYDCWRPNSGGNHDRLMIEMQELLSNPVGINPVLRETLYLAQGIVSGTIIDRTNGATFYYAPASMIPVGSIPPWARGKNPVASIGSQLFFKL